MKFKVRFLIFFFLSISYGQTELKNAYFASGCFWCVESIYESLEGVNDVVSGYSGGWLKNPSYRQVLTGKTGHAEVAKIYFNKNIITFEQILNIFWQAHDPTTLNRQGNDVGSQYRSVIFYHNDEQKEIAEKSKENAGKSEYWKDPIVTEITMLNNYSDAEGYHDNYYDNNPNQPYCLFVIRPKLNKLQKNGIID